MGVDQSASLVDQHGQPLAPGAQQDLILKNVTDELTDKGFVVPIWTNW